MDGVNLFICYFFLKLQDFIPHALNQYKTYETVFFSKVTGNGESSSHSWWSMLIWFTRFVMVNLYHTSESLSLLLFKKKNYLQRYWETPRSIPLLLLELVSLLVSFFYEVALISFPVYNVPLLRSIWKSITYLSLTLFLLFSPWLQGVKVPYEEEEDDGGDDDKEKEIVW